MGGNGLLDGIHLGPDDAGPTLVELGSVNAPAGSNDVSTPDFKGIHCAVAAIMLT